MDVKIIIWRCHLQIKLHLKNCEYADKYDVGRMKYSTSPS